MNSDVCRCEYNGCKSHYLRNTNCQLKTYTSEHSEISTTFIFIKKSYILKEYGNIKSSKWGYVNENFYY